MEKWRKVAVILSGCGVADGTEIMEATSLFFSLHKHKVAFQCYAPDKSMHHVINHMTGNVLTDKRNVLIESARICRGNIKSIATLTIDDYDGLVMPGGFGVAKNLSNYAIAGQNFVIDPSVETIIKGFYKRNKPIGACCISPILLAKTIKNVKITLGSKGENFPYADAIEHATAFGAMHEIMDVGDVCIDEENMVVTTPAFMKEALDYYSIYKGNDKLIEELLKLM